LISGIAYVINKNTLKCQVSSINDRSFDVQAPSSKQINRTGYVLQIKNPIQLFDLSQNFVYAGQVKFFNALRYVNYNLLFVAITLSHAFLFSERKIFIQFHCQIGVIVFTNCVEYLKFFFVSETFIILIIYLMVEISQWCAVLIVTDMLSR
jgi:hypothetical protein